MNSYATYVLHLQILPYLLLFVYFGSMARNLADIFTGSTQLDTRTTIIMGIVSCGAMVAIVWYTTYISRQAVNNALRQHAEDLPPELTGDEDVLHLLGGHENGGEHGDDSDDDGRNARVIDVEMADRSGVGVGVGVGGTSTSNRGKSTTSPRSITSIGGGGGVGGGGSSSMLASLSSEKDKASPIAKSTLGGGGGGVSSSGGATGGGGGRYRSNVQVMQQQQQHQHPAAGGDEKSGVAAMGLQTRNRNDLPQQQQQQQQQQQPVYTSSSTAPTLSPNGTRSPRASQRWSSAAALV